MLNALNKDTPTSSKSSIPETRVTTFWRSAVTGCREFNRPTIARVTAGILSDDYPKTVRYGHDRDGQHKQQPPEITKSEEQSKRRAANP
jgi:hypothetical protein